MASRLSRASTAASQVSRHFREAIKDLERLRKDHTHLIAAARDVAAAETYFINLPKTAKNNLTYSALLDRYCKELMTDKAEALLEKMKELKLSLSFQPYFSLMKLYMKSGVPEKVP